jgi:hypothetical protein
MRAGAPLGRGVELARGRYVDGVSLAVLRADHRNRAVSHCMSQFVSLPGVSPVRSQNSVVVIVRILHRAGVAPGQTFGRT